MFSNSVMEQINLAPSSVQTEALKVLYHTEDKLFFQINNPIYSEVIINLYNSSGSCLYCKRFFVDSGISNHTIDIEKMPSGIYQVKLISGQNTFTQSLQIVR